MPILSTEVLEKRRSAVKLSLNSSFDSCSSFDIIFSCSSYIY